MTAVADKRIGGWLQTYRGRQFWPIDPRPEDVYLDDIAHHLAYQCRFAGACRVFYSVAEHCVRVSEIVPTDDRAWALLHDASEAYLVDLPRPIKHSLGVGPEYRLAEAKLMDAICERFGLPPFAPRSIDWADDTLLMTEARDLMAPPPVPWRESVIVPLPEKIEPWPPAMAEAVFLDLARELGLAKLGGLR